MQIMMTNPFKIGRNKAAFQGEMSCPLCSRAADPTTSPIGFESGKQKIKLLGNVGPFMREYQCGHCGGVWRYDIIKHERSAYSTFKRGLNFNNPVLNTIKNTEYKKHYIKKD